MGALFSCCRPGHWSTIRKKKTEPPILYTVIYNSENHFSILFQRLGSAWPDVMPFCIFNCLLMILLRYVDPTGESFKLTGEGHKFMSFVMAFLIVSRVTMALSRFNDAREGLGKMYRESRELVQNLSVLTMVYQDRVSKEWRAEVTYRVMLFLRTAMGILEYSTTGIPNWKIPELNGVELDFILNNLLYHPQNTHYAIEKRCEYEENMRVPTLIAALVRKSIVEHVKRLPKPLGVPEEMKLLSSIDECVSAFSGLRKFKTTPVPFPLVQMARTFLFLYLFTVPLVMLTDKSSIFAHCFAVFLLTYGFMGLEVIAIELDDPFGDDPIDFKCLALAHTAFEDTYLTILDVDGADWADFLRYRMNNDINDRLSTEQSWLLSSKERFADLMVGKTEFKRIMEERAKVDAEQRRSVIVREARKKKEKTKMSVRTLLDPLKKSLKSPAGSYGST